MADPNADRMVIEAIVPQQPPAPPDPRPTSLLRRFIGALPLPEGGKGQGMWGSMIRRASRNAGMTQRNKASTVSSSETAGGGSERNTVAPIHRRESNSQLTRDGFLDVFGILGVPMVTAFLLSSATLLYMAFVQVFPTKSANLLMNTNDLDYGEFWLISEPPMALVVISTAMLILFAFGYLALAIFVVFLRKHAVHMRQPRLSGKYTVATTTSPSGSIVSSRSWKSPFKLFALYVPTHRSSRVHGTGENSHSSENTPSRKQDHSEIEDKKVPGTSGSHDQPQPRRSFKEEFLHIDGIYHAYYNALFDLPKLVFQTATLVTYLSEGFPLPLIVFYISMLMLNWSISFYRFQRLAPDHRLIVTRLFYLFDLFFAVFAPIVVLAYSYHQFKMDREEFELREKTLSQGSYDRIARLFADPVEVDVFRYGFTHLQFTKTWYVLAKIGLNVLVLYKWKKIIVHLIQQNEVRRRKLKGKASQRTTPSTVKTQPPLRRKRHLLLGIGIFAGSMASIISYTCVAIFRSVHNCTNYPQCKVISYGVHEAGRCPCVVFIDRELAPRTYHDWINPPDVTFALAKVAEYGHLKTVQVINRAIPELPEELRSCKQLEQLILIYTKTQSLPQWVGDFDEMHYLHVESDFIHYPLHTLPADLFSQMHHLRLLRFGGAAALKTFPSVYGLGRLTTLVFSIPRGLTELPDFRDLVQLANLVVADATHVRRLPSLQPLKSLKSFSLLRRNAMCCNGFLTRPCDLGDFQCRPRDGEEPITCEPTSIPEEDLALLHRIDSFLCNVNMTSDLVDSEPSVTSTDGVCGGRLYRECALGGRRGICYNGRMQVVHCDVLGEYEALRRLEIARGIGPACDPTVEAWLGCTI